MLKIGLLSFYLFFVNQIETPHILFTIDGEPLKKINREDYFVDFIGEPIVNFHKFIQLRESIEKKVYEEPTDATLDDEGNIVPSKPGHILNPKMFEDKFFTTLLGNGPIVLDVPLIQTHPKVDSEFLSTIRSKQIGEYTTFFKTANKERSHNIELATKAINNTIVYPGETFSFNRVVGKRTKDKGYMPAPVIVRGELTEGIGGGICQVSSTLYNAVDKAGVHIVERYSHSKSVPYVPPGRDATVSWYGPDFTFTNKYNQAILIRAKVIGGKVLIKIYSSDDINYKPRDIN